MPFFKRNDQTVFFAHIPKTGGSSVEKFLIQNGFEMSFFDDWSGVPCTKQHRHNNDRELKDELNKTVPSYMFTIVRHPTERALSEFFFRLDRSETEKSNSTTFHTWLVDILEVYKKYSFINDNHIRPQVEFLWPNINVFKFGDWDVIVNELSKALDLQIKDFPCVQQGPGFDAKLHCNSTEFSSKVLGWVPDKKTTDLIEDFYKEDLRLFNLL